MNSIRILLVGALSASAMIGTAFAEDAAGKWIGVVKAPGADIPFNVTVAKGASGDLTATAESPTQAPGMVIPTEAVKSDGASFSFDVSMAQGSYSGTWDAAKNAWVGIWKQSGINMPLEFTRAP
ncbi:MAG: hypothetical protein ABMA14_22960 [Hyphomonadaceae bacterium]